MGRAADGGDDSGRSGPGAVTPGPAAGLRHSPRGGRPERRGRWSGGAAPHRQRRPDQTDERAVDPFAEAALRMLGVPADDAARLALGLPVAESW